jgi:putative hemolysin
LIGIINGAFGGARVSEPLAQQLIVLGIGSELVGTLGYIIVVTIISVLDFFSKMMKLFVWVLSKSSLVVYKLLGLKSEQLSGEKELEIK